MDTETKIANWDSAEKILNSLMRKFDSKLSELIKFKVVHFYSRFTFINNEPVFHYHIQKNNFWKNDFLFRMDIGFFADKKIPDDAVFDYKNYKITIKLDNELNYDRKIALSSEDKQLIEDAVNAVIPLLIDAFNTSVTGILKTSLK